MCAIWLNPFATVFFTVCSAVTVECCVLYRVALVCLVCLLLCREEGSSPVSAITERRDMSLRAGKNLQLLSIFWYIVFVCDQNYVSDNSIGSVYGGLSESEFRVFSKLCPVVVVVVGPPLHRKMVQGSNKRFYAHRPMVFPHLAGIRARWSTGGPLHSTIRCPTPREPSTNP